jgi:glycosyltransferase involved in cell wall biosynthesis
MRILFLTNFYLVQSGGEEESCRQVVEGLEQRGHTTLVLTSMHGSNNHPVEVDGIYRSLYLEMDLVPWRHSITFFTQRKAREAHNLQVFKRVLEQFEPDIIFIWGMWNLPYSLAVFAEAWYPHKVVYRFATYWPTLPSQHELYWRTPGRNWYTQLPKQVLGHVALATLTKEAQKAPLAFRHAICVSAASRDILIKAGIPISNAQVIYTGLDVEKYLDGEQLHQGSHNGSFNLLYAGRLISHKGIDTAIRAMTELVFGKGRRDIKLSLAGSGSAEYESYLHNLVNQAKLNDYVSFLGWVPPEEMPELLRKFDVLLVPSIWPEPFARVVLEGMISGLVVVATPSGGTLEILADGQNGLLFAPEDTEDLAQKIICLADDADLRRRLTLVGQQTIKENFTITKMLDQIESYLQEIAFASPQKEAS